MSACRVVRFPGGCSRFSIGLLLVLVLLVLVVVAVPAAEGATAVPSSSCAKLKCSTARA